MRNAKSFIVGLIIFIIGLIVTAFGLYHNFCVGFLGIKELCFFMMSIALLAGTGSTIMYLSIEKNKFISVVYGIYISVGIIMFSVSVILLFYGL